ncbi:D-alanyl-D-alanine carboxypeptidase [Paraburkholderia piptadeniae]|uniref:D-alanyl-D-alanine carboxypeptidase n=1 Tax=Paraburkholderia piptadeniae TaxID=1701573 RepID=A0A1N7RKE9_9BURK|nr:serine hydrolase [Paraburkholderia piptadeniae]SIT35534.1 D-alanyl-D-alanine carboxypeptidase [Paraburkholderia piptadeniae]
MKMMKFICALLLAAVSFCARADTPPLYSPSVIVYDVARGEVLLEKNADDVRPIASLTKLMTAMIVIDNAQAMADTLTIDGNDIDRLKHSGSRLPIGASLQREDLLRLALMSSENRAASALSRSFPGGQTAFIQQMNRRAQALHMVDTHFEDPTGLSPDNVSTARDVVKMAREASHYPLISSFTTLSAYAQTIGGYTRFYHNTDPVIRWDDWDVQLAKTGYTREAGRCIVVDVIMHDGPVIIVLLGARSSGARTADLATIRNWVDGDQTPVGVPRLYHATAHSHHHHAALVSQAHSVKVRFAAWRPVSTVPSRRHATHHIRASRTGAQAFLTPTVQHHHGKRLDVRHGVSEHAGIEVSNVNERFG